jgi:hypothetical protein
MRARVWGFLLPALSTIMAGCDSGRMICGDCSGSVVVVDVPPDRRSDVVGVNASGACSLLGGFTCGPGDASTACAIWSIDLESAGPCSIHVRFQSTPDVVFTTSVSYVASQCCPGLRASPAGPFEVPSLSDGGN